MKTNKVAYLILLPAELDVFRIQTGHYSKTYEESDVWERLPAVNLLIAVSHLFQFGKTFEKEVIQGIDLF